MGRADLDVELFAHFPREPRQALLARLELASREFPAAREVPPRRPLCDQNAVLRVTQDAGDDVYQPG
jgi:hypothetical protein